MGHKFIAENIAYHLKQDGHEVLLHDILKVQEGLLVDVGTWIHSFINRRLPFVWRWLYFSNFVNLVGLPLRVPLAKGNSDNLYEIVKEFQPDLIISTQTTASAATASLIQQKKFSGKFIIAFSDYHFHKFWHYQEADFYLVNIEEQKQELINLGVNENDIEVCGITLKPLVQIDTEALRSKFSIPSDHKVVIFGSGSLGIGFSFDLLKNYLAGLSTINPKITTLVMCGKNEQLLKNLRAENLVNVVPLGFYTNPSELYQMADVLVTKPGGLTIAEAIQAKVKILITHTLPGQEEPNYSYLLHHGLVEPIPQILDPKHLVSSTLDVLAKEIDSETPFASQLIQRGMEGKLIKSSINKVFHIY